MLDDATMPIVVFEDRTELHLYSSVLEACRNIEAIDVQDGVYEAFDGRGRRIQLLTHGRVVMGEWPTESEVVPDDFEQRIRAAIERVGLEGAEIVDVERAVLPEMLNALLDRDRGKSRQPRETFLDRILRRWRRDRNS
jgi:hypothetical protein